MAVIRSESRSRIGIDWYDNEEEAEQAALVAKDRGLDMQARGYDFGYMAIGRCTAFDAPGEFAVVTP